MLDEHGKELLERIEACNSEIALFELEDAFVKGFSLGASLMGEAMTLAK